MPTDLSHQANSFDEVAELYDRVRPRYPDALFDDMLARAGVGLESFVLELGCGTGIATLPVAERGHFLLGLEPGPNLVALLWRKLAAYPGATILETTFEAWDGRPGLFDLVYVAQAFHWLDPATRFTKSAEQLRPGGWLAVFGHVVADADTEIRRALDRVYAEIAPTLVGPANTRWYAHDGPLPALFAESDRFEPVEIRRYPWRKRYSAPEYRSLMETISDHRRIPEPQREALLDGLALEIEQRGGAIDIDYDTTLFAARKRDA